MECTVWSHPQRAKVAPCCCQQHRLAGRWHWKVLLHLAFSPLTHRQGPFPPQSLRASGRDSLPFPSSLCFQLGMCWEMSSKAAFAVCSGSPPSCWTSSPGPAQLPWEARQDQQPGSLGNAPLGSMAHTATGCNSSSQRGKDVPALQGKALKGLKPKRSKILQ